ncbi:MAG: flagellar basal body-associated FliL family protein [Pseudomonadota bacterium]
MAGEPEDDAERDDAEEEVGSAMEAAEEPAEEATEEPLEAESDEEDESDEANETPAVEEPKGLWRKVLGVGALWRKVPGVRGAKWVGRLPANRRNVVVAAAAAAAVVMLLVLFWPTAGERPRRHGPVGREASVPGRTCTLDPFIFAGPSEGEQTIFKITLAIYFTTDDGERLLSENLSAVRRDIYYFLSHSVAERSFPGQKAELQEQVRNILNARFGAGQVERVYFRDFLVV